MKPYACACYVMTRTKHRGYTCDQCGTECRYGGYTILAAYWHLLRNFTVLCKWLFKRRREFPIDQ
jgi:hypothetical protein